MNMNSWFSSHKEVALIEIESLQCIFLKKVEYRNFD